MDRGGAVCDAGLCRHRSKDMLPKDMLPGGFGKPTKFPFDGGIG